MIVKYKKTKPVKAELYPEVGVWTVMKGSEVKYAWPRDGKSSLEVAKEIQANWK